MIDVLQILTLITEFPCSKFRIHHISYIFHPIFGALVAVIVGSLTSLICKEEIVGDLNPMLFSPFVRKFIKTKVSAKVDEERICVSNAFEIKDTQL